MRQWFSRVYSSRHTAMQGRAALSEGASASSTLPLMEAGMQPGWSADDCTSSRADSSGLGRVRSTFSIINAHEPMLTDKSVLCNVRHTPPQQRCGT